MHLLLLCFLLGFVTGLRSLTPLAAVACAAHWGWLHFAGTRLAFLNRSVTLIVFTLLAIIELIGDKLPKTPARTAPVGLIARIVVGGFCGCALATSAGGNLLSASIAGIAGAVAGTFSGYNLRKTLVRRAYLPDLGVASIEDLIVIAGSFVVISRL